MGRLSEIIKLKINELKISQAELGRRLNGLSGQQIGYYIAEKQTPSLDFAIKWKEVFHENLIDMIADEGFGPSVVHEDQVKYETLKDKYINTLEQLNVCRLERDRFKDELEELKKFGHTTGAEQLKEPPKEPVPAK